MQGQRLQRMSLCGFSRYCILRSSAGRSRDIRVLWKLAGQRRKASAQQLREALGPDFSLWDDFPEQPGQARPLT